MEMVQSGTLYYPDFAEIVIMEDNYATRQEIEFSLVELGYKVRVVTSAEEALNVAQNTNVMQFIIDIRMGNNQEHEGLTALELLRDLNRKIFVGILSGYANVTRYERMAHRFNVNVFQTKSLDTRQDVYNVLESLIEFQRNIITMNKNEIAKLMHRPLKADVSQIPDVSIDHNIMAYKELCLDSKWSELHLGKYVAFVLGKFIAEANEEDDLLQKLDTEYFSQSVFFIKVEKILTALDVTSPLSLNND